MCSGANEKGITEVLVLYEKGICTEYNECCAKEMAGFFSFANPRQEREFQVQKTVISQSRKNVEENE